MTKVRPLVAVIDRIPHGAGLDCAQVTRLRPMTLLEYWWYRFSQLFDKNEQLHSALTDEDLRTVEYTVEIAPKLFARLLNSYKLSDPLNAGYRVNLVLTPSDELKVGVAHASTRGVLV